MSIDEIQLQLRKGKVIEDILEKFDWREFERIISEIFKENDFQVRQNLRFKTSRRYEIDILAVRHNLVFCVDCKWWHKGRYKKTGLKYAVASQEKRVKEFKKFLKKNKALLKLNTRYPIYPLLITLLDEDMIKENKTFVVPVWKLNSFINNLDAFI